MKKIKDVLLGYFAIIIFFIGYIFYSLGLLIGFIYQRIVNIFTKKCKKKESEIVAIHYYREYWPDLIACTVYEKGKYNTNKEDYKPRIELSLEDFDLLRESIKKEELLRYKHYIGNHFVSFEEYRGYFCIDGGPTNQRIWFVFKDGTQKKIDGYSKRVENFTKILNKVTPEGYFMY